MNKAQQVKEQIKTHYTEGVGNYHDLSEHLQNDRIDNNELSMHKHSGYDIAMDRSLLVLYYHDGSGLVVGTAGITAI